MLFGDCIEAFCIDLTLYRTMGTTIAFFMYELQINKQQQDK